MKCRGWFLGLSLLLAAVVVGSILFTPKVNRLQAVPAHARLIYSKQQPGNLLSIFPNLRTDEGRLFEQRNAWVKWLEKNPLAVATVSFDGRDRRDTWVAVSELSGLAATALRWRLMLFAPDGVSPARPYAVWPVWKIEHPSFPSWVNVRFAVTEGLLICSVSGDSHDIYRLLDTADGRADSLATR